MDALDYWRLCDELSVVQAALLVVGEDPAQHQDNVDNPDWGRPSGYDAAKAALINAIQGKRIAAKVIESGESEDFTTPDWHRTTIMVEALRTWLTSRGITTGFFFSRQVDEPAYLSHSHPSYSPKLAAAIVAWEAVATNPELRRGKSVKQALAVWLRQHANEFGLTREDGNPNEQGIEDVAKIANWDTKGGAPKTPGNE
jgi:hypothetical protein